MDENILCQISFCNFGVQSFAQRGYYSVANFIM